MREQSKFLSCRGSLDDTALDKELMREEMTRSPMRLAVLYRLVARPVVLAVLVVLGIGYTLLFADSGTWHSYSINEALVHPSEPPVQPPLAPVSVSKVVVVPEPAPKPPPEPEPGVIKPTFKSAHPTEKFQGGSSDKFPFLRLISFCR